MRGDNERERVAMPSAHHFANGVYARETFVPRGTLVIGKIHRYETINFITLGKVAVVNPEQPEKNQIFVAPYTFVSPAGSKRMVYALDDCIWITVHPAESEDLGRLEEELIVKDYVSLEEEQCLGLK